MSPLFPNFDYRGSTVAITDTTGQIIDTVQYSPFGVVLSQPTFDTPFLFNGLYGVMTDDNGLSYMRARYYSAEIRRFVNQDVLLGDVADGQSLNRFAFVTGNPVSFVDPFGLSEMLGGEFLKGFEEVSHALVVPLLKVFKVFNHLFGGLGGSIAIHFGGVGGSCSIDAIGDTNEVCIFATVCGRLGLGVFGAVSTNYPMGYSRSGSIEQDIAGYSTAFSGDWAAGTEGNGFSFAMGINEDGWTSLGTSKGAIRGNYGIGFSVGQDICYSIPLECFQYDFIDNLFN